MLTLSSARLHETSGEISASGSYDFNSEVFKWMQWPGIDISRIAWVAGTTWRQRASCISLNGSGTLDDPRLEGHATISRLTLGGQRFGAFEVSGHTASHTFTYNVTTQLEGAELQLQGQTALSSGYQTRAQLDFSRFNIGALFRMAHMEAFSGDSALAGTVTIEGPLADLKQLRGEAQLQELAVTVAGVHLQSEGGAHATLADGRIRLDPLHVTGEDTDLRAQGGLSLEGAQQLDLAASGSINLKLAETLDPDLSASGVTTFQVEAHGPLQHPGLQGRIDCPEWVALARGPAQRPEPVARHAGVQPEPAGSQVADRDDWRRSAQPWAATSPISTASSPTSRSLRKEVHIRYPEGVSSSGRRQAAASEARRTTSSSAAMYSSPVLPSAPTSISHRSLFRPVPTCRAIAPPKAPSNHVRLDVHIVSSPQLNFQNAFAKLAGDVDLRLRGTLASPSLLGSVSITEGSALIAGTRYDLERGDITFTNPVRIEPVIDLSATARVEDYDISLGLHGSPQKLAVTYRSDPPLPEADVVSLLALGHTASQQRLYTQQQEQAIANPTTDALLGGALNATVSSRVQKLFGAGSVKVDPNYLGAFGNSTSRITVQEQLGRTVILTYATDVNTTSQQLLQAEVAINRHVSLVVARDESGVFSMVIKATRRYR